jgi:hypothetical protein
LSKYLVYYFIKKSQSESEIIIPQHQDPKFRIHKTTDDLALCGTRRILHNVENPLSGIKIMARDGQSISDVSSPCLRRELRGQSGPVQVWGTRGQEHLKKKLFF